MILRSIAKLFCSLAKLLLAKVFCYLVFARKTFALSRKCCIAPSKKLCLLTKHLSSPRNFVLSRKSTHCPNKLSFTKHSCSLTKVLHCPVKLCGPLQNICILLQKYCDAPKNSAFAHETLCYPEKLCILLQKYCIDLNKLCVHSQNIPP